MARSRRKTPIHGIASCDSEKKDKQILHRKLRLEHKRQIQNCTENLGAEELAKPNEVYSIWEMAKDGKAWFDADAHPSLMRK